MTAAPAQPSKEHAPDPCPNSVLGKAHLLFGAFDAGAMQLKLTELSQRSGVPKASTYRLAEELVHWGLLERTAEGYQLGLRVFELGQRVPISAVMRGAARPAMTDLFGETRATIHLSVADGSHALYVEKIAGQLNVHSHSEIGGRLPLTCTASGKVLLAHSPDPEELLGRLVRRGLPRMTARTVVSPAALRDQLVQVRSHGYAAEYEETLLGYKSFAVPVSDPLGKVYASVSATVPVSSQKNEELVRRLWSTARAIDTALQSRLAPARAPRTRPLAS